MPGRMSLLGVGRRSVVPPALTIAGLSGLGLFLKASDLSTQFQLNSKATAVSADNDPVGYWADLSANAFDFSSIANNTTRPIHKVSGGIRWVQSDGLAGQILRRLAALGMYSSGACSVFIAMRGNPIDTRNLFAERSSTSGTPVYQIWSQSDPDDVGLLIRNDANSFVINIGVNFIDEALDDTDFVFGLTDSGSQIRLYKDHTLSDTDSYTRSGSVTVDRTSIFAAFPSDSGNGYFAGRIYAMCVVLGRVVTDDERAMIVSELAVEQGRTI